MTPPLGWWQYRTKSNRLWLPPKPRSQTKDSTSERCAEHPFAGRNTQQTTAMIKTREWYQEGYLKKITGSLWVCSCFALSEEFENFLLHPNSSANLQLKGFWPVWLRTWIFRFSDRAKERLQFSNWNKTGVVWNDSLPNIGEVRSRLEIRRQGKY